MADGGTRRLWDKLRQRPLIWDTITTTAWSTAGKAVGFMVPFFVAAWFGISRGTDAFFFVYGIILFLAGLFAPVVETVIVPYISEERKAGRDGGDFIGRVLSFGGIGLLALLAVILLIIRPIISAVTRFDSATLDLVHILLLETAPLVILLFWTSVLNGALNSYKKFAFPAVSPAFRAVIALTVILVLKDRIGVQSIALGYVAGELVRMLILLAVIRRIRLFRLRLSLRNDRELRSFLRTASYQTLGMIAIWMNPVVDKTMASWLGEGSVSVLHYADRLYIIPIAFICTGLMATTLSHWSSRYYEKGYDRMKEDVTRAVKMVGMVTIIIMVFLLLVHGPVVRLAFGRGAFDRAQLPRVSRVWVCYLVGLVPYVVARIYYQAHLVLKNTRFLMGYAFLMNALNIGLNYLLMKRFDVAGLAIATSICYVFSAMYLGWSLFRKLNRAPAAPV
jgi:putative peptidoglycan lipid II flippase